jgi:uncharacterized membrane protein
VPTTAIPLPTLPHADAARVHSPVGAAARSTLPSGIGASAAAKPASPRNLADIEERLGENWLNKIGTAAFVIGVALLLNYSMHYLGPLGKIILGYVCSAALIGAGVVGESKERYRIPARAVLGGGWALAYFTTYALHNVEAVRIVDSATIGFGLLFAVAVAMVVHSLRYRSEITTGFAYLLGFTAVAVSEIPLGALFASALLAASLAYVLRARRWFIVEPFAIVATYFVHWLWLNQIFERLGGPRPFPEFPVSVGLISAYWAIYMVSYFLREAENVQERQLLTASFLLNAAGYLTLLHEQSFHPEWRFWFLLFAGCAYFAISAWARETGRRTAFMLASTLGAILVVAAIPYRYSGGKLEIVWLIEVEALLIAGWRLADRFLRALAAAAGALLVAYVFCNDLLPRLISDEHTDIALGWLLIALAAGFFLNGLLKRRIGDDLSQIDDVALTASPIVATAFVLAAAWVALPSVWIAIVWLVAGIALAEIGRDARDRVLLYCGHAAVLFAVARLFFVNLFSVELWGQIDLRVLTVAGSAALLYAASRRHVEAHATSKPASLRQSLSFTDLGGVAALYTIAATLLAVCLIDDKITSAAIGLAWGLLALLLVESGDALGDTALVFEGRILLFVSFGRIFIADLNARPPFAGFASSWITVTLLASIYFYVAFASEESPVFGVSMLWLGTISVAGLIRFQMPEPWVAVWWAGLAAVLYALSRFVSEDGFRWQCYAMTLLVALRCGFDNFYKTAPWEFTNIRIATVIAASLLIYFLFAWAKISQADTSDSNAGLGAGWSWMADHEQHLFFFVPTVLLTILISIEVHRGFLTAAWGVEAVVVFLAVLKMDERAYRWFSLGLLSLCVFRIVFVDVWNLDALGRIVSFLGLGAALLLVSFLYARHREVLRRVL